MSRHVDPRGLRGIRRVRADAGSVADVKKLLAELQGDWEKFKEAMDEREANIEAKFDDVITREKVDRINTSITELQGAVDDANKQLAALQVGGATESVDPDMAAYAQAFDRFFRKGVEANLAELGVKAKLTTGSDPDGGFVVPSEMESTIDRVLENMSAMRSLARVLPVSSSTYKKLVTTSGADAGWVDEKDARPETGTPKLAGLEFPTFELYANPAATQTLLDDASVNIADWLADEVSMEFAEQEGDAFINGDGVVKPKGLLAHDTVPNENWRWGTLGYVATGKADGFADDDPADAFIDMIYGLRRGYRQNARWLMNDLTTAKVRKFKDGQGNYLWQPSSQMGEPAMFMGYGHEADDWMPDVAANATPVAFGDFMRGYLIIDRIGIRVLRDPFTNKPHIQFYTTKRVGGGVQNFQAIKLMKIAAN